MYTLLDLIILKVTKSVMVTICTFPKNRYLPQYKVDTNIRYPLMTLLWQIPSDLDL